MPAILGNFDDDLSLESFILDPVSIYYKVDRKNNKGEIMDIKPVVSEEVVPKMTYNLNDYRYVQFLTSSYFLYDENGNKLTEWKKSDSLHGTEIIIKDGFEILISDLDKNAEYYYMFRIKDTQGSIYETDLVKAK